MGSHFTMPTQLATINQMSAWVAIDAANFAEAEAAKLKSTVEAVMNACTAYDQSRQAATTNSDLSPAGQQAAIRRAAEHGGQTVKGLCDKLLSDLKTRAGMLSAALTNSLKANTDANTTALLIERRSLLSGMDALSLQTTYNDACYGNKDELTALAIETAPAFMKYVTPEVLEIGKATRAAMMNPSGAEELDQVRAQYEILALSRNAALKEMAQMEDTIAEQAKGQIAKTLDENDEDEID